jgi:hypothetical protein
MSLLDRHHDPEPPADEWSAQDDVPAEEWPTEELPVEARAADELSAEEWPADELPVDERSPHEWSGEELPAGELPAEDWAGEEVPAEELPAGESSAAAWSAEDGYADTWSGDEVPAGEPPVDDVAADDWAGDEVPAGELPAESSADWSADWSADAPVLDAEPAAALTEPPGSHQAAPVKRPLYPRLLHLQHIHPNAWQRAVLGEGAVGLAGLLVLADLATAWTLIVLPLAVAAVVKGHDLLAGLLGDSDAGPADL